MQLKDLKKYQYHVVCPLNPLGKTFKGCLGLLTRHKSFQQANLCRLTNEILHPNKGFQERKDVSKAVNSGPM